VTGRTLLVVPTGPAVGLTSTCLGLLRALDRCGVSAGYVKPLAQPHPQGRPDESAAIVRALTGIDPPDPLPAEVVEERLSTGHLDDVLEQVVARWQPVAEGCDVVVVEGLKPGPTQIYSGRVNGALANAVDAAVVLVGAWPSTGGEPVDDLDDAALERLVESLAIPGGAYDARARARVVGCVVTRAPSSSPEVARQARDRLERALTAHDLRLLGAVPYDRAFTEPRVRDLVADLRPRVLSEGELGRRIREVSVFAQAVPGGLRVLEEGRLVVVPGDRSEVVMAACLAALNGTRLAALLLTAGVEPHPQVWELARAATATGLPVLLTDGSTYATAMQVHDLEVDLSADDLERAEQVMVSSADALDGAWLADLLTRPEDRRLSPAAFRYRLTELARSVRARIVLPEGTEPRTLQAAAICAERGIARPVLLAAPAAVQEAARALGLVLPDAVEVVDPAEVAERCVAPLVERRRAKGWTDEVAREHLTDPIMVGTVMLALGEVDGLVAGAEHTTADTVRPALQVLGTAPGARLVSSVFFMCLPDEVLVYGDCAINPQPTAAELADIAVQSAASARAFGVDPRVAMISFSTGTSGAGVDVQKVAEATALVREREPGLAVDGPLQYDAATTLSVARSKRPGSEVAGRANVFVFPDLDTGNTTYKAVQRSADVVSIGPMLQGMAKPVNDLSRGASVDDIVGTIALTAVQAGRART
jgi:phosphate acetyltransferase